MSGIAALLLMYLNEEVWLAVQFMQSITESYQIIVNLGKMQHTWRDVTIFA